MDNQYKVLMKIYPQGGKRAFNGLSSNYDSQYPRQLVNIISREDYNKIIQQINKTLQNYWSCDFCHYFSWGFALCTFGLSFLGSYLCVKDAYDQAQTVIEQINYYQLKKYQIKIELKVSCGRSWIEIQSSQYDDNNQIQTEAELMEL